MSYFGSGSAGKACRGLIEGLGGSVLLSTIDSIAGASEHR